MYRIKQATARDADRLWEIRVRSILAIPSSSYEKPLTARWASLPQPLQFTAMIEDNFFLAYELENELCGSGCLDLKNNSIEAMFVLPEKQGLGVGRAILKDLLLEARRRGIKMVTLSSTLNAEKFYTSVGFESLRFSIYKSQSGQELKCVNMKITP